MSAAYIPDGYTAEAYVAARPGLHPAVSFNYRPIVFEQVVHWRDRWSMQPTEQRKIVPPSALSKCLLSWDVKNPITNDSVPVSLDTIRKLQPLLLERMFYIVIGEQKGDERPDTLPSSEQIELTEEAALERRYAVELQQDNDAKNSSAVSSLA